MSELYAELDQMLASANIARAEARRAYLANSTREMAHEFDVAAAVADRIGEHYLRARFEHEADQAGMHVDPKVFEVSEDQSP